MPCFTAATEAAVLGAAAGPSGAGSFPEPGVERNYGPSRTFDIDHIQLHLSIEPAARLFAGEAVVALTPLPTHEGEVVLDLDEVTVDAVTDADSGEALGFLHDGAKLRVRGVTERARIKVTYRGEEPTAGLYFTGPTAWASHRQPAAWTQCQDEDAHYLVPCIDHPGVKHSWSIRISAPTGYTLLSNGALAEEGEDGEGRVFARYEQVDPMPAYLLTCVVQKLVVVQDHWRDRPVRYLMPAEDEDDVGLMRSMGHTPEMMEVFSRTFGVDYAWPRYDQVIVHEFIFGGMENTACTTMTDVLLVDGKASLQWDPDGLVSHELAHQWFGDLLTCQDWSQAWLNESWATFSETVWWDAARDGDEATWYAYQQQQSYLGEDGSRYRRAIVDYRFKAPIDVFDRHLYEKGSVVLRTMRTMLGEQAFWAGCKTYLTRHRHQTVHTRHFQRAMEDATGRNLDRFFDQWILGAGHPVLTVKLGHDDGLLTVQVTQSQTGDDTASAFHLPLVLELVGDGEPVRVTLPVRQREQQFVVPASDRPHTVRVDPGFNVLAEVSLEAPRGWLELLAMDACPVLATRAIDALMKEGSRQALDRVVRCMGEHPFWAVRGHAAKALAKRGGASAREALLAALDQDEPRALTGIVEALGSLRHADVATALLGLLETEPATWQLHGAILESLGKTRDPRARAALLEGLTVESWASWVPQKALAGLGHTDDPEALPVLLAYAHADKSDRERAAAARALGALADRVESARQSAVDQLVACLEDGALRTRLAALAALSTLKDARSMGAIQRVHTADPVDRVRRGAYEALAEVRKGRTAEAGLAALRSEIEKLTELNTKLRSRIEKLEARANPGE